MTEQIGNMVIGTVSSIQGRCLAGHKVGDQFELSFHKSSGLCGGFYHDIFHYICLLQFEGRVWGRDMDVMQVECPDRNNLVKLELRRLR